MVQIVKKEWHQVMREFSYELTIDDLEQIYPDASGDELQQKLEDIKSGEIDIDDLTDDAMDADVYFDWDHVDDDWWTDRKGGYDVTYELGEE